MRLVAEYASACNLFGDTATVRHKLSVPHGHCADVGRDLGEIRVTHLGSILVNDGPTTTRHHPPMTVPGTVDDHIGR